MKVIPLEVILSGISKELKEDLIPIFSEEARLTHKPSDEDILYSIEIYFSLIVILLGFGINFNISYDQYVISLEYDKEREDWEKVECTIRDENDIELHFLCINKTPGSVKKLVYEFKEKKAITGLRVLFQKIAETTYALN